jgi:hypothetical protein
MSFGKSSEELEFEKNKEECTFVPNMKRDRKVNEMVG